MAGELLAAYYKMERIEHFARISLVARILGRERLLSREEVMRLQDLRGSYGIAAPAPICTDENDAGTENDPNCQVIQVPSSPGERLVSDPSSPAPAVPPAPLGKDEEIRLTPRTHGLHRGCREAAALK